MSNCNGFPAPGKRELLKNYIETSKRYIQEHRLILEALKLLDTKLATDRIVDHLKHHEQHAKDEFPSFKPITQPT